MTGNLGYVGPVVCQAIRRSLPSCQIVGFDTGFFVGLADRQSHRQFPSVDRQIYGDIRRFPSEILDDVDVVVHLAAISNDPMGMEFESATRAINEEASIALASQSRLRGVQGFVFASSCSIYGDSQAAARVEGDALNPLTAYARSKVAMEAALEDLAGPTFQATALRFATACGMSPGLRLDLVLNEFVADARRNGIIRIESDGTPWRPLVHVEDMARAICWAIVRPPNPVGSFLALNVGSNEWNLQVIDLATAVQGFFPECEIVVNRSAPVDRRSYRVDFSLFELLAPEHQPQVRLSEAIADLAEGIASHSEIDVAGEFDKYKRLKVLRGHIARGLVDTELFWTTESPL